MYNNEEIKINRLKWLEALESGDWNQARNAWYGSNIQGKNVNCCLNVANRVLCPNRNYAGGDQSVYKGIFEVYTAPQLGMDTVGTVDDTGCMSWFINLNDKLELSFVEIAAKARELWNLPKAV